MTPPENRRLMTDPQRHRQDDGNGQAWWRRVAQFRRLESPLSNGRHRSGINVLAHASQEPCFLYCAVAINEISTITTPRRPVTSSPERSGFASTNFEGTRLEIDSGRNRPVSVVCGALERWAATFPPE